MRNAFWIQGLFYGVDQIQPVVQETISLKGHGAILPDEAIDAVQKGIELRRKDAQHANLRQILLIAQQRRHVRQAGQACTGPLYQAGWSERMAQRSFAHDERGLLLCSSGVGRSAVGAMPE